MGRFLPEIGLLKRTMFDADLPRLSAAALAVVVAFAHSYLGERFILIRLFRRTDLPHLLGSDRFTKQTLRLAWHITSVLALGIAAVLARLAPAGGLDAQAIARILGAAFALSGLVALVVSRMPFR
jgi:hypothetical protein